LRERAGNEAKSSRCYFGVERGQASAAGKRIIEVHGNPDIFDRPIIGR
jgi:hypothetical protein